MKKLLVIICVLVTSAILLKYSGVSDSAIAFVLTGAIPSTSYNIPPLGMLSTMTIGLWLIIATTSIKLIRRHIASGQVSIVYQKMSRRQLSTTARSLVSASIAWPEQLYRTLLRLYTSLARL